MSWGHKRGIWGGSDESSNTYSFNVSGIVKTILEVVPGGVLRAGKTAYTDDARVGFWLGVDSDGLAKFNLGGTVGGKLFYLKWTGAQLDLRGDISWIAPESADPYAGLRWLVGDRLVARISGQCWHPSQDDGGLITIYAEPGLRPSEAGGAIVVGASAQDYARASVSLSAYSGDEVEEFVDDYESALNLYASTVVGDQVGWAYLFGRRVVLRGAVDGVLARGGLKILKRSKIPFEDPLRMVGAMDGCLEVPDGDVIVGGDVVVAASGVVKVGAETCWHAGNDGAASGLDADLLDGQHASAFAIPAGVLLAYGGAAAPAGWLLCDGAAASRSAYGALFAAIGTAYGTGDGAATFNLPDMRQQFPRGKGASETLGATGGAATHTHADHGTLTHSGAAVADHAALTHSGTAVAGHAAGTTGAASAGATQRGSTASTLTLATHTHATPALTHAVTQPSQHAAQSHSVTQPSDHAAQSHDSPNSEPPYVNVNWIIKT